MSPNIVNRFFTNREVYSAVDSLSSLASEAMPNLVVADEPNAAIATGAPQVPEVLGQVGDDVESGARRRRAVAFYRSCRT